MIYRADIVFESDSAIDFLDTHLTGLVGEAIFTNSRLDIVKIEYVGMKQVHRMPPKNSKNRYYFEKACESCGTVNMTTVYADSREKADEQRPSGSHLVCFKEDSHKEDATFPSFRGMNDEISFEGGQR